MDIIDRIKKWIENAQVEFDLSKSPMKREYLRGKIDAWEEILEEL